MNPTITSALDIALHLAQGVVTSLTGSGVAAEVIADATAAVEALVKVRGSAVTYGQLEAFRNDVQPF